MTTARKLIISDDDEAVYHCWSRCVRRAFLCGTDKYSGKCYDHRKEWIRERLQLLASIFTIEILGYALMENHQHLLVRVLREMQRSLSDRDVAIRWLMLFPKKRKKGEDPTTPAEKDIQAIIQSKDRITELRGRLGSVSWFMKALNEHIARRANKEDQCTGAFWEGRFKCKRVDDEAGLLACSVYIDLNPIRAGTAKTPEESEFTSVQERIKRVQSTNWKEDADEPELWIAPIERTETQNGFLSISLSDYLTVVDTTGRIIAKGKQGKIPDHLPPILERIGIKPKKWHQLVTELGERFSLVVGCDKSLETAAEKLGKSWLKGTTLAREAFN